MKNSALFFVSLLCVAVSLQAGSIHETFDQNPDAARWHLSGKVRVIDGYLEMSTAGAADVYLTSSMVSKAGDTDLNFTARSLEIELKGLQIEGSVAPADKVFMAILASDAPNEMNANSFVKLRISGDGALLLTRPDKGGRRGSEAQFLKLKIELPIRRLALSLSPAGFALEGESAAGKFKDSGVWEGGIDLTLWSLSKPYFIVKAVRRPGQGDAQVMLDELNITPVQ